MPGPCKDAGNSSRTPVGLIRQSRAACGKGNTGRPARPTDDAIGKFFLIFQEFIVRPTVGPGAVRDIAAGKTKPRAVGGVLRQAAFLRGTKVCRGSVSKSRIAFRRWYSQYGLSGWRFAPQYSCVGRESCGHIGHRHPRRDFCSDIGLSHEKIVRGRYCAAQHKSRRNRKKFARKHAYRAKTATSSRWCDQRNWSMGVTPFSR